MTDKEKTDEIKRLYPNIEKYLMYASRCKEEKKYCKESDQIIQLCFELKKILK